MQQLQLDGFHHLLQKHMGFLDLDRNLKSAPLIQTLSEDLGGREEVEAWMREYIAGIFIHYRHHRPLGGYFFFSRIQTTLFQSPVIRKVHNDSALAIKGREVAGDLSGTCLFLVGMMGCGKSTVAKDISEALSYEFQDSDKLVEKAIGATVAKIFSDSSEDKFRAAESEALNQLSETSNVVVATGGGAVVRDENWRYLKQGITIYLDVPVEALAQRVVAAGLEKRPLLVASGPDNSPGNAHEQALARLSKVYAERNKAYERADLKISVAKIASELGRDLNELPPSMIALKVLEETQRLINRH
ncbi:uncharacterized protein LOC9631288 isoform X1 [Selaginella moellendorffii]|uniref:uncharacterized protein LOC9631288 isoform X1 n=2 Tax=Selaginella moellendorffii TaxID=88036 RepID=UPI000D1C2468|nr:uncharacterized protein LOC9631288 isoform X1 [Selaginella moellendorffii]|eukprot:XP_024529231.1 uncharacterized protein LOC9631288 isoform X1 [Selaginella moellendorffii]